MDKSIDVKCASFFVKQLKSQINGTHEYIDGRSPNV
jgi:hypothetical protein